MYCELGGAWFGSESILKQEMVRLGLELTRVTVFMTCNLTLQKINDLRLNVEVKDS